jgi:hypothetical protein
VVSSPVVRAGDALEPRGRRATSLAAAPVATNSGVARRFDARIAAPPPGNNDNGGRAVVHSRAQDVTVDESNGRREFLKAVAAIGAAGLPAAAHAAQPAPAPHHGAHAGSAGDSDGYLFLSAPEAAFVEAALASLIPADELGPGAREAGVATFIDRQLAGAFGAHARNYRQGPWAEGTPEQGFQSPPTP